MRELTHNPVRVNSGAPDAPAAPRHLAIREKVTDAPNFRDYAMMVDKWTLALIASLQKRYGMAWAAESGLRFMIWQDSGHCPGVGTMAAALDRLERQGVIAQEWLAPGQMLPDRTTPCTRGTRFLYLPQGRVDRRRLAAHAAARNRRKPLTNRYSPKAASLIADAAATIGKRIEGPATPPTEEAFVRAREFAKTRLEQLRLAWKAADPSKPPT